MDVCINVPVDGLTRLKAVTGWAETSPELNATLGGVVLHSGWWRWRRA